MLDLAARRVLFGVARSAIERRLHGLPPPPLPPGPPELHRPRAAFVTLWRQQALRGCIGRTRPQGPLVAEVRALAVSAAIHDRRFAPLTPAELPGLELEISVLTPLEPADPTRIEVGRHGLAITLGDRSGLLLPRVASERGWDARTFLEHTCRKADLASDAWQDPAARLEWFTSDVYEEPPPEVEPPVEA